MKYLKYYAGAVLSFLLFSLAAAADAPDKNSRVQVKKKELNVLLITLDTLRTDRVSIYTDRYVSTPHIDKLARRSFVFKRAFSHNPVTLPAHTNIMTGTTPLYHGIGDNTGFRLEEDFLTIAEYLKERGYQTGAFIGAFPLDSRFGLDQGFDQYDDQYGTHNELEFFFVERRAEAVIKPAIRWLSRQKQKWFAWVHLFDPHQPYFPPPPYDKKYSRDPYSGEVAYMDACLGTLFDFLEKSNLMENTAIVITGDHGEALGEKGEETHSYFAYNNTIHIPLIVYVPGNETRMIEGNVCHADIFPTICDILDFEIPGHIQGETLIPIIEGRGRKDRAIYFESLTPYLNRGWAPLRGFIAGDIKFIDLPIKEVYHIGSDFSENSNIANNVDVKKLKRDLIRLKRDLTGKDALKRSQKIDAEVRSKLKSLGYLSGGSVPAKKVFGEADDLKVLLPLQNRMLAAIKKYHDKKIPAAIAELREIMKESPGFTLLYRHLATIYKESGQTEEAIATLRSGLQKNPDNINLMSKLGITLAEANRPDEAIELLNICTKKERFNPENYNFLGVAYYKKGDFGSALQYYKKALELDHNYASVFNNLGSLYLVVYIKRKDENAYQLAMQHFNRALEIDPQLFAAYNGRGAAYKFKKKNDAAIADWQKVIEIKSDFVDAYFNIGIAYLESGDKESALKYFLLCQEKFNRWLPPRERERLTRLINEARR
jgi:arylsulfatase A-like enzyme/Flp pilus assembly protein TadD